jgi:hypothetical protein
VQVPSHDSRLGRLALPLAVGAVGLSTVVLGARALVAEGQTVDDVFIFLRYARNLAMHGEYAFNAGAHVEGTSSVAWTLALALAWRVGWRGLGAAKALSLAVALLVPLAGASIVGRAFPRRPWLVAVPVLALALDADFATWAVSGMDTALWTLACMACVALAAGSPKAAAVLLGALAWVRPEGPLFAAAGVVALARDRRSLLRLGLLAAAPVALLTALRAAYFHDLVPNTFWAKMNAADGKDYTGPGYVVSALVRRPLLLVLLPLASLRTRGLTAPFRVALALLAASLAFALLAGGDWMPDRRLLVVALPLASVLAAAALACARPALVGAVALALVAEAGLTCDHAIDQDWREHEWLDERVAHWRPVRRPFVQPYPLDWMPTHLLREIAPYVTPGSVVAHVDVGELPYVMGDVAFLDGFGLVDREAGRVAFSPRDARLRSAAREAFFAARPVAAIVVLDEASGRPFSPAQDAVTEDSRFAAGWRELERVPTWGGHPCVTYIRRDARPVSQAPAQERARIWLAAVPDVQ